MRFIVTIVGLGASMYTFAVRAAVAASNCTLGPPADIAALSAALSFLAIDPCTVSTDAANCANPGNDSNTALWNSTLQASGDLNDELVVFLPGGGQNPANLGWFGQAAAFAGYRTIGLAYEGDSLENACGSLSGDAHSECVRLFRRDVILGTPSAPAGVTDVHRANSAEQRLLDALAHLDTTYPNDGWDQYSNGATPEYDKIIIAGYSLGSGHAAFWARIEAFAGAVTLSGPTDSSCVPFSFDRNLHPGLFYPLGCTVAMARWIRDEAPATPGTRRYGAFHAAEATFGKLDAIIRAWDNFGLPRPPGEHLTLDVTGGYDFASRTPWPLAGDEHRFSFNTEVPQNCSGHQAAAADSCLEIDAGSGLPQVFPLYMQMFCGAGRDLP